MAVGLDPSGIMLCSSILLVQSNVLLGPRPTAISFLLLAWISFVSRRWHFLFFTVDRLFSCLRYHYVVAPLPPSLLSSCERVNP